MMSFGAIENIIYILPLAVFALVLVLFYGWWRRHSLKKMFGKRLPAYLSKSGFRIAIKEAAIILSIILIVLVLLRPQWGVRTRPVTKQGSDLLVILDVSKSMNSEDVLPSRLNRAKNALKFLSSSLNGDRVGLIIFAGDSFLLCPFTSDIGAFHMFVDSISTDSIQRQGTDIGSALNKANSVFEKRKMTNRLVLLITDGEDHEGKVVKASEQLKVSDVKIYTAGLGDKKGAVIPENSEGMDELYVRDRNDKLVKSKINRSLLKKIASMTGGKYIDINRDYKDLEIIKDELKKHKSEKSETRMITEPVERYQVFVLLLIILMMGELFVLKLRNKSDE